MSEKEKQHDQKFEYSVVLITAHKQSSHAQSTYANTTIVFNTGGEMWKVVNEVRSIVEAHAENGWRLKCDLKIDTDVMLIFERLHADYLNYNDEIVKFLKGNEAEV